MGLDLDRWTDRVLIESPRGAFVVGIESPGPAALRAVDADGRLLSDATGEPAEIELAATPLVSRCG